MRRFLEIADSIAVAELHSAVAPVAPAGRRIVDVTHRPGASLLDSYDVAADVFTPRVPVPVESGPSPFEQLRADIQDLKALVETKT